MIVRLRKFVKGTEGTIMVLTALGLVAFLGFATIAIDLGHLYVVRNELQNVADAAALAGVSKLIVNQDGVAVRDSAGAQQAVINVAQSQAALSGLTPVDPGARNDITVSYGNWNIYTGDPNTAWTDSDGSPSSNANAVRVAIRRAEGLAFGPVTNFLAGIFGSPNSEVAATATAYLGFVKSTSYGAVTLPVALPTTALTAANQDSNSWWAQWLGPREAWAASTKTMTFRDLGTEIYSEMNSPKLNIEKAYLVAVKSSDSLAEIQKNIDASNPSKTGTKYPVDPIKVGDRLYALSEYNWGGNIKDIFNRLKQAYVANPKTNGKWRVMLPVYKAADTAANPTNHGLWMLARVFSFGPSPAHACYKYSKTINAAGFVSADVTNVTYNSSCVTCTSGDYNCIVNNVNSCRNQNSITFEVPLDVSSVAPPGTKSGGPDYEHITGGGGGGGTSPPGVISMQAVLVR